MNSQRSHFHNNQKNNKSKPKTIKSIRIIERSPSLTSRGPAKYLNEEEFSFKKKKNQSSISLQIEEKSLNQILQKQEDQIQKLKRMLKAMKLKSKQQDAELQQLDQHMEIYQKQKLENLQLKNELHQLKDLMKGLLLQKQNMRMLTFYQEQY